MHNAFAFDLRFSNMGKDAKKKGPADKGKGKQAASGSDEGASKGKGGGKGDKLGTCNFVKGRLHLFCYPVLLLSLTVLFFPLLKLNCWYIFSS